MVSVRLLCAVAFFSFVSVACAQTRPSYYDPVSLPSPTPRLVDGQETLNVNATGCLLFKETLFWGVTDAQTNGEVSRVQDFLHVTSAQKGVYDEATELAVRAYQRQFDLVKPGLSCKTGYGIVERKTREYMNAHNDCTPIIPRKTVSCMGVAQCPTVRNAITRGQADAEGVRGSVATVQCFLARQGLFGGPINGSYGSTTEVAVRAFQKTRGLAVSGVVNAQTREAIGSCAPAVEAAPARVAKSDHYTLRVDPARGTGPLTVTMTFAMNGTTCSSYEIVWGDGTAADSFDAGRPTTCSPKPVTQTYTHTYTVKGIYDITLRQGQDALSRLPVSNTAQVIVE